MFPLGRITTESRATKPRDGLGAWLDFEQLRLAVAELIWRRSALGILNPRPPGWHNSLIQLAKKLLTHGFRWHTRPFIEFDTTASRSIQEIDRALHDIAAYTYALERRLTQLERRGAELPSSQQPANVESNFHVGQTRENYRTAYVIGLYGSGRQYVVGLILRNIGERAKYFRDTIRVHPGPTLMIYSGHATIRRVSRAQHLPEETSRVLESVEAGFADLIFVYRHPLDSLLTNWIWWQTFIRENRVISGISEVFRDTDELCAYLEQNFANFRSFAEGDLSFFAAVSGAPFLSFAEFVEETELYLRAATLALRFEDFVVDPVKQFSKIVNRMGVSCNLSRLHLDPPKSKPYGYLAVMKRVLRFRDFIEELDAATKEAIRKIGYNLGI